MKKLLIFFTLSLFAFSSNPVYAQACEGAECIPEPQRQQCVETYEDGCIDWTNGIIYAVGDGVPNPKFKSRAQQKKAAKAAAKAYAMRNLLLMIEGINLTSQTTVKDGMLESETIRTQISGKLRHVQQVGRTKYDQDGTANVVMRMYMKDILPSLFEGQMFRNQTGSTSSNNNNSNNNSNNNNSNNNSNNNNSNNNSSNNNNNSNNTGTTPPTPTTSPYGGDANQVYTGLVVDARGLGLLPAAAPKIIDEKGWEVYGSAYVDRDFAVAQGMIGYSKDIEKAKANPRVSGKPLVLKALKTSGRHSADIVLSMADAKLLRDVNETQAFLRETRVMAILD